MWPWEPVEILEFRSPTFVKKIDLNSQLFIPKGYTVPRLKEMNNFEAKIKLTEGTCEKAAASALTGSIKFKNELSKNSVHVIVLTS